MKSTVELACNPKLKGKVPSAIKEVLANGIALEELTIGMVSPYWALQIQQQAITAGLLPAWPLSPDAYLVACVRAASAVIEQTFACMHAQHIL